MSYVSLIYSIRNELKITTMKKNIAKMIKKLLITIKKNKSDILTTILDQIH